MKPFYVYILQCNDQSYYTGHTDNIEKRISEHTDAQVLYTKKRLPIKVMFVSQHYSRAEALISERKIKNGLV